MKELSLNVLDLVENSVKAGAAETHIELLHEKHENLLTIRISDNGCGMTPEFLETVTDPFSTTRTTRKVGMGIPLFKLAAEMTGGRFKIHSVLGEGTTVEAIFCAAHIDMPPVGNMADTVVTLLRCHPDSDFVYRRAYGDQDFELSTKEIRMLMEGIPLNSPEICAFVRDFIVENTNEIYGGNTIL